MLKWLCTLYILVDIGMYEGQKNCGIVTPMSVIHRITQMDKSLSNIN